MWQIVKEKDAEIHPDPLLTDLANQVLENWNSKEMGRRRKLWTEHYNCKKQEKIPVKCALFDSYYMVWQNLIPEETIVYKTGIKRNIETQLRIKLEKFRRFHDDDVIWPILRGYTDLGRKPDALWGVELNMEETSSIGGSFKPLPPIKNEQDLERITVPDVISVNEAEKRMINEMSSLTDGLLQVKIENNEITYGPYEWAVRMRGAENLLFDVYDRPEWVHKLMDRITTGIIAYHKAREKAGMIDFVTDLPYIHVPFDSTQPELENKLAGLWAYIHAQSSASLGPAMYEEFVHPYNARLAHLFGKVYYHGCENLGQKVDIIRELPNLCYFHVSPWTKLADVVPKLRNRNIILEVHSNPSDVLFSWNRKQMRDEIKALIEGAQEQVFDLKICDIQTINGAEGQLECWADVAMEESLK